MRTLFFIVLLLTPCISFYDEYNELQYEQYLRQKKSTTTTKTPKTKRTKKPKRLVVQTLPPKSPDALKAYFPPITNNDINATMISTTRYPSIASVYHSGIYLCTAACIQERIFITAARCIANALVVFTQVTYKTQKLKPIAFVIPFKPTKQMFDDIGFIIVDRSFKGTWDSSHVIDQWNRTDENFVWFGKVPIFNGTAIGYVDKNQAVLMHELDVVVSNYLCYYLYNSLDKLSGAYFVPCYHSCTLEQDYSKHANCQRYLAGEGHIVLNDKKKIVGIATWGPGINKIPYNSGKLMHELPIGMAIPNSKNFYEDLKCAVKIKQAPATTKSYADLCKT